MATSSQTRRAYWAVPAAAIALLVAGSGLAALPASAAPLPQRTPQQLLVDLQTAGATPLQGTVTQTADLGLPAIPASLGAGGASLESLLAGTHTIRVWTDGAERSRVAVLGTSSETDLIRNGRDVWLWQSSDKSALHTTIPADDATGAPRTLPTDPPRTPQEWADLVLAQADATTRVTSGPQVTVAGRPAFALVLTPKASASGVREVTVAIDGEQHVPLRVQVFSTQLDSPAIQVGFTDVAFTTPEPSVFAFEPAEGVTVTEATVPSPTGSAPSRHDQAARPDGSRAAVPTIVGTGWDTVATGRLDPSLLAGDGTGSPGRGASTGMDPASLVGLLPTASGSWGSGHVLDGTLVSIVVTDDGRFALGAVSPEGLYAALPAR